ncbi:MAG: hypothetical protein MHM6MM_001859 [Cercozoa sp. M6MM]
MSRRQGRQVHWHRSSDIDVPFDIHIHSLAGRLSLQDFTCDTKTEACVFTRVELVLDAPTGGDAQTVPQTTPLTPVQPNDTEACAKWQHTLHMGLKIRDLVPQHRLAITVFVSVPVEADEDSNEDALCTHVLGAILLPVFDRTLCQGFMRVPLRIGKLAVSPSALPSETVAGVIDHRERQKVTQNDDFLYGAIHGSDLDRAFQAAQQSDLPRIDWLDELTLTRLRQFQTRDGDASSAASETPLWLNLVFPSLPFPCVYDPLVPAPLLPLPQKKKGDYWVHDPEGLLQERAGNPIEIRRRTLHVAPQDIRPNAAEKSELALIIASRSDFSARDRQALWDFRYSLLEDPHALTKFLRAVDWTSESQSKEALKLMRQWAPIGAADALELLSPQFTHKSVRSFAVEVLRNDTALNDDAEFSSFLLPLITALRYEPEYPSELSQFLLERATSFSLCSQLYWNVRVAAGLSNNQDDVAERESEPNGIEDDDDAVLASMYASVLKDLVLQLPERMRNWLLQQRSLLGSLSWLSHRVASIKDMSARKKWLRKGLEGQNDNDSYSDEDRSVLRELQRLTPAVRLPIQPRQLALGILGHNAIIFQSAMAPLGLCFEVVDDPEQELGNNALREHRVIWKIGDDLRQDQMVIQLIQQMDQLLKRVNLDMCLTPYAVLATSSSEGFVDFVPNVVPLRAAMKENDGDLRRFFAANLPGVDEADIEMSRCLDTYVKSLAGYSVISYLLGLGDRHLDNLLLQRGTGKFLHIDFGFIFGEEPPGKPFPPVIKLRKEMVAVIVTHQPDEDTSNAASLYRQFELLCTQCFATLRRHAALLMNLTALMDTSRDPRIRSEHMRFVEDRFMLGLSDEQAELQFLAILRRCMKSVGGLIIDFFHDVAN